MINRRTFVAAIVCGLASSARAQTVQKNSVVGLLHTAPAARSVSLGIVLEGLRELGYVDGRNVALVVRSASGKPEALPGLAAELARLDAKVIVAVGPAAVRAAQSASRTIAIVALDLESDPIEAGFVSSLSRPGANITGLFLNIPEMAAKWLDLLKEAAPGVRRVLILWDSTTGSSQLIAIKAAAGRFAIEPVIIEIRSSEDLEAAFTKAANAGANGMVMLSSPIISLKSNEIAAFTAKHRLAGIAPFREFADAGGLLAYGPNLRDFYRRVPSYVDKILKGARPSDLPVEQPTTFDLVINVKTAKALGMTISSALQARANDLIQ